MRNPNWQHVYNIHQVFVKARFLGGCNDGPFPGAGTMPNLRNGTISELLALDFADPIDYTGEWTVTR